MHSGHAKTFAKASEQSDDAEALCKIDDGLLTVCSLDQMVVYAEKPPLRAIFAAIMVRRSCSRARTAR